MRRQDEEFWQTAEDWSRRKHLILRYYLTPAAAKLRQVSPDGRVVILDGFAGRGQYEDGSLGSPILIGQLADLCHTWSNPVDLRVFNVEPDPDSFRELHTYTAPWQERGVIRNLEGTFREHLPYVLAEADRSPLFAFLDPFRPKHLPFADFAPLLTRRSVTELCFVFHTPAVVRLIRAVRPEARTRDPTRQANRDQLNQIFGSGRWEELLSRPSLEPEAVVACFMAELLAQALKVRTFVYSHRIQARYGVGLKYHIVFFTRNPHGVRLMNDAFCEEAEAVYERTGSTGQLTLGLADAVPAVEMEQSERIRVLRETFIAIGREYPSRPWKRADLIFEAISRHFGDFSQSEHLQAVTELLNRTRGPRYRALDGRVTKSGRWITNNQTTLLFQE